MSAAAAYDPVAELYDRAFADIRVRRVELRWLTRALSGMARASYQPRVLEIGCGTGALLRYLAPRIQTGVGVDISQGMIAQARARSRSSSLTFHAVADSGLPFDPGSFDVVISFLSFRYLDWPRTREEIARLLAPGGRFLLVDLVSAQAQPHEAWRLARAALRNLTLPLRHPRFSADLRALTSHPDWHRMLARHPARSFDEYRSFLGQHWPERPIDVLDVTMSRRVIAFDSGPRS